MGGGDEVHDLCINEPLGSTVMVLGFLIYKKVSTCDIFQNSKYYIKEKKPSILSWASNNLLSLRTGYCIIKCIQLQYLGGTSQLT